MSVVVFGSINMDLIVRAPRLPVAGETLAGHTFFTAPGGKGANQAVACARLGAATTMIGRVGADDFGTLLRHHLGSVGVNTSGVITDSGQPSGIALITVNDAAENTIVVVAGANGRLDHDDVARLSATPADARVLLLQLEVPIEAVLAAAQAAHARGVKVVVDPAPAQPLPPELYAATDILTPNQSEAALLVGFPVEDRAGVEHAAVVLLERGARSVVIKLGAKGAYWTDGAVSLWLPAFPVTAVDTVAAGDAFNGALAVGLDQGAEIGDALAWGLAAGALAVTKAGAQPSLPQRSEVVELLAKVSGTRQGAQ